MTAEHKKTYDAITVPEWPGETTWFDRLRPWENFVEYGPQVADFMRGKDEEFRKDCPDLWDLLFQVFPSPPAS